MITVLNNQNIKRRNLHRNLSVTIQKKPAVTNNGDRKDADIPDRKLIVSGKKLNSAAILVLSVIIMLMIYLELNRRESVLTPVSFPRDNSAEMLLLKTTIPEHNTAGTLTKKLSPSVIKSLKIVKYRVRKRDTLSSIAQKYRLKLGTLISYNNIRDARRLSVGTLLEIPNRNGLKYRVRRGDSLSGIATGFRVPLREILDWNSLSSSIIQPGQELFIAGAVMNTNDLNRVLGKLFIYPTRGRLTSRFGMRHDPFTGIWRFHNGIDLANRIGTPVAAAMAGSVAMVGINPTYGRYVILRHPDGFQTLYAHLSRILISKGRRVSQNQIIGKMGTTGYSTGSHLHFSIFKNGEPVDPLKYLH